MQKVRRFFSSVTGKKHHVEFFTALLTIPVLLTVLLLNVSNLNTKKTDEGSNKPTPIIISLVPQKNTDNPTPLPTKEACKPGLGKVTIANPHEGDTVSDNPANFTIYYDPGDYCAAVWSYRINGAAWSDYDDKSIALYDLPSGSVKFDLRVKSVVAGGGETTLTRNITYVSSKTTPTSVPTVTLTPTSTVVSPTTTP